MRLGAIIAVALGLSAGGFAASFAQEVSEMTHPVVIPQTEVFDIHSVNAEADFQIWVASPVPGMMPFPPGPRRCLYVLDANLFFGTAVEMTRIMSQL